MALSDELTQLSNAVGSVGTATVAKNQQIEQSVTNEATARSNADNAEANTRSNADIGLQNNINAEAARAEAAEAALNMLAGSYRGVGIISGSSTLTGDFWGDIYASSTGITAAFTTTLSVASVVETAPKIAFLNNSSYPWTINLSNGGYVNSGQSSGTAIKQLVLPPGTSAECWFVPGGSLWVIGGAYAIGTNGPGNWRGLVGINTAAQTLPADPWGFIYQTVGTVTGNLSTTLPVPSAQYAGKRMLFVNNSPYIWTIAAAAGGSYIVSNQSVSGASVAMTQSTVMELYCDGSNWIVTAGNYIPNGQGKVAVSSAAPSGGSPGDTWYQV